MRTMRKEVDFTTFKGFLGEDLVYDKQENALFSYILYNDDFINKEEVSLTSEPRNPEIAICQTLDAPDLVEAYEKGQLKGKLKEIAANLDEESNPVVMLLKRKVIYCSGCYLAGKSKLMAILFLINTYIPDS